MSVYSPEIIAQVSARLAPRAVLSLIAYRPDTILETGGAIRCFCPIHKETVFRTMAIDGQTMRYRCSYTLCKGAKGGDLIDLYAKALETGYDEALLELVHKLQLPVQLPPTAASLDQTVRQGWQKLQAGEIAAASEAFHQALLVQPGHIEALKGLLQVAERQQNLPEYSDVAGRLIPLLTQDQKYQEAQLLCETLLDKAPDNAMAQEAMAANQLAMGDKTAAIDTYMRLADQLEEGGLFDQSLAIYRAIEKIDVDVIDAYPHIINAMLATDRRQEAADETQRKIDDFLQRRDWRRAIDCMRHALMVDHERDDLRRRIIETALLGGLSEAMLDKSLDALEELVERRQLDLAATLRDRLTEMRADSPRLMKLSSLIHKARGNETAARQTRIALADHLLQIGAEAQARSVLEALRAEEPSHLPVLIRLGAMYRNSGETPLARDAFKRIVRQMDTPGAQDVDEADLPRILDVLQSICEALASDMAMQQEFLRLCLLCEDGARASAHLTRVLKTQEEQGLCETALELIERHGVLMSDQGAMLAIKARCLEGLSRIDESKDALMAACEAYIRGANRPAAIALMQRHIQRYPNDTAALEVIADLRDGASAETVPEQSAALAPGQAATPPNPSAMALLTQGGSLELVREYTFENFVVDDLNNFAYATSMAVAKAPAQDYNPLFIHGDVGLGKTHLINAIGNYLLSAHPELNTIYMSADDFAALLVDAIARNDTKTFRDGFRQAHALLIDDIQFLAGKQRAQEEFFNIFNTLYQAKRQIVISSDRPPRDLQHLENRLRSRFGAGVVLDIKAPGVETREAILLRERAIHGREAAVPDDVIHEIASRISANVRELKGMFKQAMAMADVLKKPVDIASIRQFLDQSLPEG